VGWGVNGQGKSFSDDDGAEARPHGSEKTGGVDVIAAAAENGLSTGSRQVCDGVALMMIPSSGGGDGYHSRA
jgi:hypothetical protein